MPTRSADAVWKGDLKNGGGTVKVESGAFESQYSFVSRFETGKGTNPEELIAAAHAGCYSMALSNELAKAGHKPESVSTKAEVVLDMSDGPNITTIKLISKAQVPGIDKDEFLKIANGAKEGCPVSKALASVNIELDIELN
ncbi:MAG: OsmC family protein [Balneolia bacterium]|nr:OsmC family protein [Balneolia bacterium]